MAENLYESYKKSFSWFLYLYLAYFLSYLNQEIMESYDIVIYYCKIDKEWIFSKRTENTLLTRWRATSQIRLNIPSSSFIRKMRIGYILMPRCWIVSIAVSILRERPVFFVLNPIRMELEKPLLRTGLCIGRLNLRRCRCNVWLLWSIWVGVWIWHIHLDIVSWIQIML